MAGATGPRPQGITILAILALIGGIFQVLGGLSLIGLGGLAASVGVVGVGGFAMVGGLVLLALGVAELAVAYGFWTIKPWAWRLGVILALASVLWALASQVLVGFDLFGLLISIVVSVILIYYLNLPAIRTAFGAPASGLPIVGKALDSYLSKIKS